MSCQANIDDETLLSLLIVEDEEIDRRSIERKIKSEKLPYELCFAESVREAHDKLESQAFDIMLLDYNLGDGSAFDILSKYAGAVPAIVVTGNGDEKVAVEAIKSGAYDYLIKDSIGNYLDIIAVSIEKVLKRKNAEQQAEERKKEIERSNKDLEQFAYIVSHDLNEPLRAIKSFSEILAKRYEGQLDEEADEFLDYIVGGCDRLQNLISELLKYSRVCGQKIGKEEVQVTDLLNEVQTSLKQRINESSAMISIADNLPKLYANRSLLSQLFQNLFSNAIKFCDNRPEIRVDSVQRGDKVEFSVRDNGIGIADEQQDRVFQIFQRLHSSEEYEGTGIGLALCRKIVEGHGGKIWLESEPGHGTTFHFTLAGGN